MSDNATKAFLKMPEIVRRAIRQSMYQIGIMLVKDLKEDMKKPKSGRVYKIQRGKRIYRHIASAPNERPASRTGRLRKSVNFLARGFNAVEFGSNGVDYAKYLEYGTQKMQKRAPFLRTVELNNQKSIGILKRNTNGMFNIKVIN